MNPMEHLAKWHNAFQLIVNVEVGLVISATFDASSSYVCTNYWTAIH